MNKPQLDPIKLQKFANFLFVSMIQFSILKKIKFLILKKLIWYSQKRNVNKGRTNARRRWGSCSFKVGRCLRNLVPIAVCPSWGADRVKNSASFAEMSIRQGAKFSRRLLNHSRTLHPRSNHLSRKSSSKYLRVLNRLKVMTCWLTYLQTMIVMRSMKGLLRNMSSREA